jgi:hypothetical protein
MFLMHCLGASLRKVVDRFLSKMIARVLTDASETNNRQFVLIKMLNNYYTFHSQ